MKKILLASLILISTLFSAEHIVEQKGKVFIPQVLDVAVGDTIIFKNFDPFAHNAYTDDTANEFDIGVQVPGKDITAKIVAPGEFNVECAIHPNMILKVKAK